jgi:hypothetical protein
MRSISSARAASRCARGSWSNTAVAISLCASAREDDALSSWRSLPMSGARCPGCAGGRDARPFPVLYLRKQPKFSVVDPSRLRKSELAARLPAPERHSDDAVPSAKRRARNVRGAGDRRPVRPAVWGVAVLFGNAGGGQLRASARLVVLCVFLLRPLVCFGRGRRRALAAGASAGDVPLDRRHWKLLALFVDVLNNAASMPRRDGV